MLVELHHHADIMLALMRTRDRAPWITSMRGKVVPPLVERLITEYSSRLVQPPTFDVGALTIVCADTY